MSARATKRIKDSIGIEYCNLPPVNLNRQTRTRRNVRFACDPDEFRNKFSFECLESFALAIERRPVIYTLNELPQPHEPVALGLLNLKPASCRRST